MGHCGLHSRAATQPGRHAERRAAGAATEAGGKSSMNGANPSGPQLDRVQTASLIVGLVGLAFCVAGWVMSPKQFFQAYLVAYIFWLGLALGCLTIAMIHHLAGGRWGFAIRRLLEAASRTLPLLAILFIPILFGLRSLYIWTDPATVAADELLQHKHPYLNAPFFII